MTNYLTTNANGLHTNATLAADIAGAIDKGYRVLQATLRAMRGINVYEGKINGTHLHLVTIARELLEILTADAQADADEAEAKRMALLPENDKAEDDRLAAIDPAVISPIALQWLQNKHRGSLVMVAEPFRNGNRKYLYTAYGSHARALGRLINREVTTEFGFSKVSIASTLVWHSMNLLRAKGIELILVD